MIAIRHKNPESRADDDAQAVGLTLTLTYSSGNITMAWSGDLTDDTVIVDQDDADFTITLATSGFPASNSAIFDGTINWFDSSGNAISQPSQITDLTTSNTQITFSDENPQGNLIWCFSVDVSCTLTSPDPTIINADVGP